MFTGIIQKQGYITSISGVGTQGRRMTFSADYASSLDIGESIAVNGVCLTVSEVLPHGFAADISPETMACTCFGQAKINTLVNLERALLIGDRLGGHFVTGHVDQTAQVKSILPKGQYKYVEIEGILPEYQNLLASKGSITINGVSLTINAVDLSQFSVMLIPKTLETTNLGGIQESSDIHIEFDLLAKMVDKQLKKMK